MKEKEDKAGSVELWGRIFKRVESGLDEDEVNSFIKQLMSERDKLLTRQEHLSSLAELAEKTVTEADSMANRIKEEAKTKAEDEAKGILAEAEKQAERIIEERIADTVTIAQKEIEAIRSDAEKNSRTLLKENIEKLQSNMMDVIGETFREILAQAENFKCEVTSLEVSGDGQSSELNEKSDESGVNKERDSSNIADSPATDEKTVKVEVLDTTDTGGVEEEQPVSKIDWWTTEDEEWVVLEFLPPRDQDGIDEIKNYLDSLPEINTTEIITMVDKTWIRVLVSKQTDLIKKLEALSEIQQVYEVEEDEYKKIGVELVLTSSIDVSRNKLNRNFSDIFSKRR